MCLPLDERAFLVRADEPAVAGYIGCDNGHEPSLHSIPGQIGPLSVPKIRFYSNDDEVRLGVCTENSIHVSESPNVGDDDRAVLPLPGPVPLAVQVEEPT